ncbi:DUF1692-domain-containing protein [Piromyces finnis]|uniref:DUF1692-domain-containing protein n=1 Tax=Piromyces finnis TaxID=1754191 RepID=A0A1Y1V0A1_9FUNG|nr:DUF1692-domain-containing protein [Piromyces finnis]|eukprot:ORX44336.1 DUF1692-domain-containing protein [Piromyces finnis]
MSESKLRKRITQLDVFPKIERDYVDQSAGGGFVTMIVTFILSFLIFSEVLEYLNAQYDYSVVIDYTKNNNVYMNIDLTVAMECDNLRADMYDSTGTTTYAKAALSFTPTHFSVRNAVNFNNNGKAEIEGENFDMDDLMDNAEKEDDSWSSYEDEKSSCRITGQIDVHKLAGNFHITALGHGYGGKHTEHNQLNFTHRFYTFSFGDYYPGLINPLDDSVEITEKHFSYYQYFLSIVPTIYKQESSGRILYTNQYSVTDMSADVSKSHDLPGIFIKFDFEPLLVKIVQIKKSFFHFLVRLCGIVGGIYVSFGNIYRILFTIYNLIMRKNQKDSSSESEHEPLVAQSPVEH